MAANSFSAELGFIIRLKPDLLDLGCEGCVQFESEGFRATICSDRGNLAFGHTEAISDILILKEILRRVEIHCIEFKCTEDCLVFNLTVYCI